MKRSLDEPFAAPIQLKTPKRLKLKRADTEVLVISPDEDCCEDECCEGYEGYEGRPRTSKIPSRLSLSDAARERRTVTDLVSRRIGEAIHKEVLDLIQRPGPVVAPEPQETVKKPHEVLFALQGACLKSSSSRKSQLDQLLSLITGLPPSV